MKAHVAYLLLGLLVMVEQRLQDPSTAGQPSTLHASDSTYITPTMLEASNELL